MPQGLLCPAGSHDQVGGNVGSHALQVGSTLMRDDSSRIVRPASTVVTERLPEQRHSNPYMPFIASRGNRHLHGDLRSALTFELFVPAHHADDVVANCNKIEDARSI
jgi:hypothetical protein